MTYCKGAARSAECGVEDLELTAEGGWKSVEVKSFQYFTTTVGTNNVTSKNYKACYYRLKVKEYEWMDGAKIQIYVDKAQDVKFQIFGGTSRNNASFDTNSGN